MDTYVMIMAYGTAVLNFLGLVLWLKIIFKIKQIEFMHKNMNELQWQAATFMVLFLLGSLPLPAFMLLATPSVPAIYFLFKAIAPAFAGLRRATAPQSSKHYPTYSREPSFSWPSGEDLQQELALVPVVYSSRM